MHGLTILGLFVLIWLSGFFLIRKNKNEDRTVSRKGFAKMGFSIVLGIVIGAIIGLLAG